MSNLTDYILPILTFVIAQILGIGVALAVDNLSWRLRNDDSTTASLNTLGTVLTIGIFCLLQLAGLNSILYAGGLLIFALWPAFVQWRRLRTSFSSIYRSIVFLFCQFVLYGVIGLFFSGFILRPFININLFILVYLGHLALIFLMFAFARPFWMQEFSRLRGFLKRESKS